MRFKSPGYFGLMKLGRPGYGRIADWDSNAGSNSSFNLGSNWMRLGWFASHRGASHRYVTNQWVQIAFMSEYHDDFKRASLKCHDKKSHVSPRAMWACHASSMSRGDRDQSRARKKFWTLLNDDSNLASRDIQPIMMRHIEKRAREMSANKSRSSCTKANELQKEPQEDVLVDLGTGVSGNKVLQAEYDIDPITLKKISKASSGSRDASVVEHNVEHLHLSDSSEQPVESIEVPQSVEEVICESSGETIVASRQTSDGTEPFKAELFEPVDTIDIDSNTNTSTTATATSRMSTSFGPSNEIPNHYFSIKAARNTTSSSSPLSSSPLRRPIVVPTSTIGEPISESSSPEDPSIVASVDVDKAATDTHSPIPAPCVDVGSSSTCVDSVDVGSTDTTKTDTTKHVDEVRFPIRSPVTSYSSESVSTVTTESPIEGSSVVSDPINGGGLKLKGKYRDRTGDLKRLLGSSLDDHPISSSSSPYFDTAELKRFNMSAKVKSDPIDDQILPEDVRRTYSRPLEPLDADQMSLLQDVLKATRRDELRTDEQLFRTKNAYLQNKDKNLTKFPRSLENGNFFTGSNSKVAASQTNKKPFRYQYVILDFCNRKHKSKASPELAVTGHPPDLPSFSMNSENPRLFTRQYSKLERKGWECIGCNEQGLVFQKKVYPRSFAKKLAVGLFGAFGGCLLVTIVMFADATFVVI